MMRVQQTARRNRSRLPDRAGISLLEVIIATVILAVSSVMLVRIIGTADRNASKAERRVMGQMICQNKLDEMLASIVLVQPAEPEPDLYYPDWYLAVEVRDWESSKADFQGELVVIEISSFFAPQDAFDEVRSNDKFEKPVYTLRRIIRKPVGQDSMSLENDQPRGVE